MGCLNLKGYENGCDDSIGGVKSIILVEQSGVTDFTIDIDGKLTDLTLDASTNAYKYDFLRDNANYTDAMIGDGVVSSISWQPVLNMIFKKNTLGLVQEVYELTRNYLVAFVEDNNGEFWTLGLERGLNLVASAGSSSGNIFEDPNNLTILIQGKEKRPMLNTDISTGSGIDQKILTLFGV